ncbi:TPA: aminoglycoside 6'-N-acetyltransferase, partial [Streptococcus pneumoniae]|nr:GNAT family N-acetyltransferase [Streptococcus pneumoniae]HEV9586852.1 GNAT family N-acetyltransferase [Streptococcus pneumoniae]HEW2380115.1 GNAT family N-acetyltransferase [Streptococcus pneumoniae]
VGLALCSLRFDYVEGCKYSPVGFLEGIIVDEEYRLKDIAKNLCTKCEEWAKNKGCKEFASDCTLTNTDSIRFHLNIGFQEANRIIHFKKKL